MITNSWKPLTFGWINSIDETFFAVGIDNQIKHRAKKYFSMRKTLLRTILFCRLVECESRIDDLYTILSFCPKNISIRHYIQQYRNKCTLLVLRIVVQFSTFFRKIYRCWLSFRLAYPIIVHSGMHFLHK